MCSVERHGSLHSTLTIPAELRDRFWVSRASFSGTARRWSFPFCLRRAGFWVAQAMLDASGRHR